MRGEHCQAAGLRIHGCDFRISRELFFNPWLNKDKRLIERTLSAKSNSKDTVFYLPARNLKFKLSADLRTQLPMDSFPVVGSCMYGRVFVEIPGNGGS